MGTSPETAGFFALFVVDRSSVGGFILRDAADAAPKDGVYDPHGEERGSAARLEPRGPDYAS